MSQHESSCIIFKNLPGWNIYQHCLKRRKSSALDAESEDLEIGTLSEPEWIFVFERVGAIGRKVLYDMKNKGASSSSVSTNSRFRRAQSKSADKWNETLAAAEQGDYARVAEQLKAKIADESNRSVSALQTAAQSITPEAEFVLDLRYIVRLIRLTLIIFSFLLLALCHASTDRMGPTVVQCE